MKITKWKNGEKTEIELAADEITALEKEKRKARMIERSRPLTEGEVFGMMVRQYVDTLEVDDNTALRMLGYYPEWREDIAYAVGFKVTHGGKLWRCIQAHTAQTGWEPENVPALWEQVCESHAGTLDDPISYDGDMALENGKYYVQDYTVYLCTRDTVDPVYHALSELVGLYVECV